MAENNGGPLLGTAVTFLALTYISVALRTYVRAILTKNFQMDDWLMLVAQVCGDSLICVTQRQCALARC